MGKLDVVSEERRPTAASKESVKGSIGTFEDPFYDATGEDPDSFEHGDERRGTIKGEALSVSEGRTRWRIQVVSANGASQIDAEGGLAHHSDGRPGSGTLTVSKATGEWAEVKRLNVAAKNPRRWKSV